jgi:hypothetical protein
MTRFKFHPLADIFPLMEGEEFDALVADIKANGPLERIVLYEGMILDGRNRYRALLAAGLDPALMHKFTVDGVVGDDPAAYVISANIHRRHLTPGQKRDLIAKLLEATPEKSDRQIAKTVKASHHTVETVRTKMEGRGQIAHVEKRIDTKGRKQPAAKKSAPKPPAKPQPVKSDPRIIAPEFADRVGRFARDLITTDRILARELATIIMLPGVRERLSADLTNGLAITASDAS